ncbi:hypothetical protein CQW23_32008 [Capsicum baccatum]|uniref:Uncharacterized protein n=1 Tax=Capsicum baccatum TaxID=33114 RepID=A0A2G2V5X7_CAPBA|nr:hypothetical protein CQW23_32008 [Capsicum baccatum]
MMNDIVLDYSDSECRFASMQKIQPFKRVTGGKIVYCPYGLCRALLTPVHCQLRDYDNNDLLRRTHSIISFHRKDSFFSPVLKLDLIHFKLLKVLELRHGEIDNFLVQILSLIWLRFYLPDCPSGSVDKGRHLDFSNLQTISYLSSGCCTNEVILGIQNVKKLGIRQDVTDYGCYRDSGPLNNLIHLHQLETLSFTRCYCETFPATLKKLKLERTYISWLYLDIIAKLPNLEVLKLMGGACRGKEWYPNVRGFTQLKLLLIEYSFLRYWKATNDNFPALERLVLKECSYLKEIPIEFAEIHSLQLIELKWCLSELGESATRIQKEQEDLGKNPVDVRIFDPCKHYQGHILFLISTS